MKRLFIYLIFIIFCCQVGAQKNLFVRVYNLDEKKINKGQVLSITDSSLHLKSKGVNTVIFPIISIGKVKTKHSPGHHILIGSSVAASSMAILGAASADPDAAIFGYTAGEGAGAGALLGAPLGAVIGGIIYLFKKPKTFVINADKEKWKTFQSFILEHVVHDSHF